MKIIWIVLFFLLYTPQAFPYQIAEPSKPDSKKEWWADYKSQYEYGQFRELRKKQKKEQNDEIFKKFLKLEKNKKNEKDPKK